MWSSKAMRERRLYEKLGNKSQGRRGILATNLCPATKTKKLMGGKNDF